MPMFSVAHASLAFAVLLGASDAQTVAASTSTTSSACATLGTIHMNSGGLFDVAMPKGVVVQAPGPYPAAFYVELQRDSTTGTVSLRFDPAANALVSTNALIVGNGPATYAVYPNSLPCRSKLGRVARMNRVEFGPPPAEQLPDNSITVEH